MVIGIVATMTIPGFIAEHQKHAYVTALKKCYAELNQALQIYSSENNCTGNIRCAGLFEENPALNPSPTLDPFMQKLNTIKTCNIHEEGCYPEINLFTRTDLINPSQDWDTGSMIKMGVLNTGANIWIGDYAGNCTTDFGDAPIDNNGCAEIWIDVNGSKKPNKVGRDNFGFYILGNATLYPIGGAPDNYYYSWNLTNTESCLPEDLTSGYTCAGRIMEKGWVMDY